MRLILNKQMLYTDLNLHLECFVGNFQKVAIIHLYDFFHESLNKLLKHPTFYLLRLDFDR